MSVLKGAVLFGHRPDFILSRVMKCSYGVKTNIPFDKRRHDVKQKVLMDGEEKCDNIFSQIIEKDKMVEAGTKVLKSYFTSTQRLSAHVSGNVIVGLQSREQPSSSTYDGY
jgi:hypothetical protein